LTSALILGGCATPHVVEKEKLSDEKLSCAELRAEIKEAERYKEEARKERGVTGTNVAAVLFFLPGLAATYVNTEDAIRAAEARKEHLMEIYKQKRCGR
jgi:hypothetical protein